MDTNKEHVGQQRWRGVTAKSSWLHPPESPAPPPDVYLASIFKTSPSNQPIQPSSKEFTPIMPHQREAPPVYNANSCAKPFLFLF